MKHITITLAVSAILGSICAQAQLIRPGKITVKTYGAQHPELECEPIDLDKEAGFDSSVLMSRATEYDAIHCEVVPSRVRSYLPEMSSLAANGADSARLVQADEVPVALSSVSIDDLSKRESFDDGCQGQARDRSGESIPVSHDVTGEELDLCDQCVEESAVVESEEKADLAAAVALNSAVIAEQPVMQQQEIPVALSPATASEPIAEQEQAGSSKTFLIHFAPGSLWISPKNQCVLNEVAEAFGLSDTEPKLSISGVLDSQGDRSINQALSELRAAKVVENLIGQGVSEDAIEQGGSVTPSSSSLSLGSQGLDRNDRRVEITVTY